MNDEYLIKAKTIVMANYNFNLGGVNNLTDPVENPLTLDDIYVVWFAKTLQNWKALVSTTVSDGMYYEVTYNGDKEETYLDSYAKIYNVAIPDELYKNGLI